MQILRGILAFAFALSSLLSSANPQEGVTMYCGSGMPENSTCPCGATAAAPTTGCPNSQFLQGARIHATGFASLANPNLAIVIERMPTAATGLVFQGTTRLNSGIGVPFGDGLRCVGGTQVRLAVVVGGDLGEATFQFSHALVSELGLTSGAVRMYQVWYRNAANFCTQATFNLSNAFEAVWS